jgi:hypothetical protein
MDTPKGMQNSNFIKNKAKLDYAEKILNILEGVVTLDINILSYNVYNDIENNTKRMSIDISIEEVKNNE